MRYGAGWPVVLLAAAVNLAAQDEVTLLDVRVLSSPGPGIAIVDRGQHDKLQVGDPVVLRPRQGGTYPGKVTRVDERQAIVELGDRTLQAPPGTRGEVRMPRSRLETAMPKTPPQGDPPPAEHPPWKNQDEGYVPGRPLLTQVPPLRPEERGTRFRGSVYGIGELTQHPETDFDESFLRLGTDLRLDNAFGDGGTLRFNGELNHRVEFDDSDGNHLVVRTLSYQQGGTRFQPLRWEVGRFLQQGMPELGVVDGGEVSWRFSDGIRVGGSIGAMPVPDEDFAGTQDKQIAAYALFPFDADERLLLGAGFQKTWHSGDQDRDLLLLKGHWLPEDAWQLEATSWIDLYTSQDAIKGSGVEITQVLAAATRAWNADDRLRFAYRHLSLPELLRREFRPLDPDELRDNHADELSGELSLRCSQAARFHSYLAGWIDEDSAGGAVELGLDCSDLIQDHSLTDLVLFANTNEFTSVFGVRADWVRELEDGRWNVFYEIANHHEQGYPDSRDDLLQQRLRASRTFYRVLGSELSLNGELRLWDEDLAWTLGFFFRRDL